MEFVFEESLEEILTRWLYEIEEERKTYCSPWTFVEGSGALL